jgi:hypothetical protein
MKVKEALKITDSFTRTSKMPGLSYSLPAWACQTGSKLRKVKTSPCYGCYAMKGNYTRYPAIREAQYRRLEAINNPKWVEAMAAVIKRQKWFRWHDAGDVQSHEHMAKIIEVCKLTPDTKHWLPKFNYKIISCEGRRDRWQCLVAFINSGDRWKPQLSSS